MSKKKKEFTWSDLKKIELEGNCSKCGHPLNPATAGYQCTNINCPAVESSEPQENACECDPHHILIDNQEYVAINKITKANPVSAPSESQEEIFDDLWDDILKWYEEDNPEIDWYTKRHELKKKFTITRNP